MCLDVVTAYFVLVMQISNCPRNIMPGILVPLKFTEIVMAGVAREAGNAHSNEAPGFSSYC